jgi:UTP--glucose-1-phosphate uridylyltransferase
MSVTRTVIPAAGLGTRMLPAAKAVPKELLPIVNRPTIQYVVEEAAAGGVTDVLLVTSPTKHAILNHFQPNPELEKRLKTPEKSSLLASLRQLLQKVNISAVDQPAQRGLGDAVRHAREFVGKEHFLCQLGDAVFSGDVPPAKQLIDAHREFDSTIIGVEMVPIEKVDRYGIIGGSEIRPGVMVLDTIVEKPSPAAAPSRYAVAARYILSPAIFDCIDQTQPGKSGEIQLTDAIALLMKREPVHAIVLGARRHDIGAPLDWLKTNILFAARDQKLWNQIAPLLRELLDGAS